ncbi:zinc finger AN1 domain-containing stress-associated protein 15 [Oryza brachyantha]|uniref:zinc finger AN1 domain-containing stress-associated protein 15 n=1 Tax=Oryza brachyantha TaxID=4533 RepID=UPI0007765E38|nr:zinc finger AN1 domain-containing stress-associated protein 15 [Oryza brachyantha]
MAQESCDLNKDEAEILKPSSSSSPSPSPTTASPSPPTAQMPEPPPPQSTPPAPPAAAAAPQFLPKTCEGIHIEASKKRKLAEAAATDAAAAVVVVAEPLSPVLFVNRCNVCRKRVGLTGFRCRCGELFCPRHRHSETHECSFDYKTAGREEIARANPVIRAAKIIKI